MVSLKVIIVHIGKGGGGDGEYKYRFLLPPRGIMGRRESKRIIRLVIKTLPFNHKYMIPTGCP